MQINKKLRIGGAAVLAALCMILVVWAVAGGTGEKEQGKDKPVQMQQAESLADQDGSESRLEAGSGEGKDAEATVTGDGADQKKDADNNAEETVKASASETKTEKDDGQTKEPAPSAPGQSSGSQTQANQSNGQTSSQMTCTLSVSCKTALNHLEELGEAKASIIPEDGMIFPATKVTFSKGDTVFDVLKRELTAAKIHMEFVDTPGYSSSYIEGIGNLYEFDCGSLSGWMYKVNGNFINYGSSEYELTDGDRIEWVYTCDAGADVGNTSLGG